MTRQNRADILAFIIHAERTYRVNDWKYGNIRLWPLVRIKLFFLIIFAIEKHVPESGAPPVSPLNKLLLYLDSFWYRFLLSIRLKRVDMLYAGFFAHRVMFQGMAFNRFFDPLMDELEKQGKSSLILEYTRPTARKSNYKPHRVIEAYRLFPIFALGGKKVTLEFRDAIEILINDANRHFAVELKAKDFIRSVESDVGRMLVNKQVFSFLLKKLQPQRVIGLTYYNPAMMGLILSCRERNTPVADMQHGPQGALHASYASWTTVPPVGYELLPDEFYCWNERDAQEINRSIAEKGNSHHRAVKFGNPWIDFWKRKETKSTFSSWPANLVLYTLQPVEGMLESYLLNAIQATQGEFNWWFRLHPRQIAKDKALLLETLRSAGLEHKVNIDDASTLPLPDILRHTSVHLTKYSGCFLEAMEFEVPSIIIDERGVSIFNEHLQSDRVIVDLEQDTDKLLRSIRAMQLK